MARDFNGTSQYIEAASAVVSAEPLTMACWAKPTNTVATHALMSIGTNGGNARWQMSHNASSAQCQIVSVDSGGSLGLATVGTVGSGSWQHYAAVFTSSVSRTPYLDGVAGTVNTTAITVSGVNRTAIGARIASGAYGLHHLGQIAECAIWNIALTADQIAALAKGISPLRFLRGLVFYAPLVGSPVIDIKGGVSLSNVNSAAQADHCRIIQ